MHMPHTLAEASKEQCLCIGFPALIGMAAACHLHATAAHVLGGITNLISEKADKVPIGFCYDRPLPHAQRYKAEADEAQRVFQANNMLLEELMHQSDTATKAAQQAKQVSPAALYCGVC